MKLAEALILRADYQKRLAQLNQRLVNNARVQEGELSSEDPQQLLTELDATVVQLRQLIQQINRTNSQTVFQEQRLSDALAERDTLMLKRNAYNHLVDAASLQQNRYSRSEIKFISTVNVAQLQRQVDDLSRCYRELDSQIQAMNWQVDLVET
ncbi:MAG: DIP1984 family protein [Scytolyngbya sp. HA4215-MV1]|jgi:hypothetical protein|nr:DIP1984 family protein [Scytolyngbya sp. HA4215-MV1]